MRDAVQVQLVALLLLPSIRRRRCIQPRLVRQEGRQCRLACLPSTTLSLYPVRAQSQHIPQLLLYHEPALRTVFAISPGTPVPLSCTVMLPDTGTARMR
jgi:hypothetical protein